MKSDRIIIKNELITVYEGAIDYNGIGYVENNSTGDVEIRFKDADIRRIRLTNKGDNHHNDWYILKSTDMDYDRLNALKKGEYELKSGDDLFASENSGNSY